MSDIEPGAADDRAVLRACQRRSERGASMVEFALLAPLFALLVFGGLTAANAYNHKLAVVDAVREGARYAATLPQNQCNSGCSITVNGTPYSGQTWAQLIQHLVEQRSNGVLSASDICVALVHGASDAVSYSGATLQTSANTACYTDGLAAGSGCRVQVSASNSGDEILAVPIRIAVTESSKSTAPYEETNPACT